MCYSWVGLKTRMSSKYIVMHRISSENAKFMRCWNVAGALVAPIGMTIYLYRVFQKSLCGVYATSLPALARNYRDYATIDKQYQ